MMGCAAEARTLSLWDYEAMLWHWNDRHDDPANEQVEAPDEAFVEHRRMLLYERGIAGPSVH